MPARPDRTAQRGASVSGRIAAWAAVAGLLVYGVAAWGSAFDRAAAKTAVAERLVPGPFRAHAHAAAARLALAQENLPAAIAAARRAVATDPIDPDASSLLGSALYVDGQAEAASSAFRVAAQFGWRDEATQIYWLEYARLTGDWDLASLRADALLRAHPSLPLMSRILGPFEENATGRAALAERLAFRPDWTRTYLQPGETTDTEVVRSRARLLAAMPDAGLKPLGCGTVTAMTDRLVRESLFDDAQAVWFAHCERADAANRVQDSQFRQFDLSSQRDPLGWRAVPDGNVRLAKDGADAGLRIELSGPNTKRVLFQPIRIAEPQATIRWTATDADGDASDRIGISYDCGGPSRPAIGGTRVTLSPQCAFGNLNVWLAPGNGPVTLKSVAIAD
ncbi:hypothetical protein [Croceicoccus sp. YJ47]|uniref:hypothetical protein n=1 Tax=Croceicoccus sp. YJ47 TaxID=2798724 RepID=UPI0019221FDE|nr:hypothetical protein [Croceicoccus sp. YJ47]QQN72984.1 hypothetical protein JD971_08730 [Croceicoccus sp. YJ47]